jgi:hypothetical protein
MGPLKDSYPSIGAIKNIVTDYDFVFQLRTIVDIGSINAKRVKDVAT